MVLNGGQGWTMVPLESENVVWIKTHQRYNPFAPYPSMNTVHEFERAIQRAVGWKAIPQWPPLCAAASERLRARYPRLYQRLRLPLVAGPGKWLFAILMGIYDIEKTIPYFFSRCRKAIYLFDAWEHHFERLRTVIRQHGIEAVFFSARQSWERFPAPDGVATWWLPEASGAEEYRPAPYDQKDIDVIEFGRHFEPYHAALAPACAPLGIRLTAAGSGGQVLFAAFADFADALGRSKICVCFPSSLTHPERSGSISTMTHRYLQAILSKCLIVGRIPEDMVELFPFSPVVEADLKDPAGQLKSILSRYESYIPLIERTYRHVLDHHLWDHRVGQIRNLLSRIERP